MYIVIEGMPGTGKTTLAKALAQKTNAIYMKSIFSNTDTGKKIRAILNKGLSKEVESFYIIDLLLDELRLKKNLECGNVVRDKVYASSLAHLRAHGFINTEECISAALYDSYLELRSLTVEPDHVIYIKPIMEKVKDHLYQKGDLSAIDLELVGEQTKYQSQQFELEKELCEKYGDKMYYIDSFSGTVDEMVDTIINGLCLEDKEHA